MREQAWRVLHRLQGLLGPRPSFSTISIQYVAHDLDIPEASVRRSIQELRKLGYRIRLEQTDISFR